MADQTMLIKTSAGEVVVRSLRVQQMIARLLAQQVMIDQAKKGKIELNFAGVGSVRQAITVYDE